MAEKWIDVSAHQGLIDWAKAAASGIRGAILRAGYGDDAGQQDTRFSANIKGAVDAGLKAAVYWFSYADSVDDALKEWAACRQIIQPYREKILFVAYDYEYDSFNYYRKLHGADPSAELMNQMVTAFRGAAKADGWKTCLYADNDYRRNIFTAAALSSFDYFWLADYSGGPDVSCTIQQTSSAGTVPGISGNVDTDTVFASIGEPAADPPYTCDTSGTVTIARGAAYQIEVVCAAVPNVVAGTLDELTILPRSSSGNKRYYYLVPIGKCGDQVGVYINGGPKQLTVKIK